MNTATNPRSTVARSAISAEPRRAAIPARNRRRHTRVLARGLASHIQTRDASTPGLAVENISMGGLFVRCSAALERGTAVMLQLVRPGLKRALQMQGRVVSVISAAEAQERGTVAGMGIGLDRADPETERRLHALVEELASAAREAPAPEPQPVAEETLEPLSARGPFQLDPAEANEIIIAQGRRMERLEAELREVRHEILRYKRTVGELANRLAKYEAL